MKKIEYKNSLFQAVTYGVAMEKPHAVNIAKPFIVLAGKNLSVAVESHDEIPLIFACPGYLGAAKVDQKDAVNEAFKERLNAAIVQRNLDPKQIQVYLGPCLTFSHTVVDRAALKELIDRGYRAACKRTNGVDFLDVPVLVLTQLRELGIPMINIHIGDYDTFENPDLLYSTLRGDKENNLTVAIQK